MPSNSLAALPSTASPTALFAQTALPQQILTPLFSDTSTLLLHSFVVRDKSSLLFATTCALFTENAGVYPPSHFTLSIFHFPFSNFFRMNAQHPMKDADPERPSGAEGFLHFLRRARIL